MSDQVIHLGLLGPVVAEMGDHPIDLGGSQRRAVLARLALDAGLVVSVESLVDGLWHTPPPTSRKIVQVNVSRLRRALPADAVASVGGGYRLDLDPEGIDLTRFSTEVAAARAATTSERALAHLDAALDLWRGPALADVGDVPFAAAARAQLDEARLEAVEARVDARLALGESGAVVGELEGLVGEQPLRERLWAQLMTALHRSGRQAEALRAYERARRALEEVGLSPGEVLLRAHDVVLGGGDGSAPARAGRSLASGGARLTVPAVFVGRDRERAEIAAAVLAAAGPGPGLVAVRGEEGLGKSSLVAAVVADLGDDVEVVDGRCREHVSLPFGPWVDVLAQLGADDVARLLDREDDAESAEARGVQLFTGTVRHLLARAQDGPVVVVLDDLHWADEGTVALLLHVLDETERAPVVVVGAWRPGEVAVGRAATRVVAHLARTGGHAVDLAPLTADDIGDMLAGHVPEVAVEDRALAAEKLLDVTSGVPLFVADALGATGERTPGLRLDLSRPAVPDTARSIVARRLTEAGGDAVPLAETLAVLGESATAELVAAVADLDPVAVATGIDELARVGLVRDAESGPRLIHAAFRAAVTEATPRGRVRTLHAAAFRHLDDRPVAAAVRAHHAERAEALVDAGTLAEARAAAGAEAAGRTAFADAAVWYASAVAGAPADARRTSLRVAHADALWRSGDLAAAKAEAEAGFEEAVELGAGRDDDALVAAVELHGTIGAGFGPDRGSIAMGETARGLVTDARAAARLEIALAYHHAAWGSAMDTVADAIALAHERLPAEPSAQMRSDLLFAEGLAMLGAPDLEARRANAEELVALGEASGSWRMRGRGLRLRGMVALSRGDTADALGAADALEEAAQRTGSWFYEADMWRLRSTVALSEDRLADVETAIEELERLSASPFAGWVFVGTQHIMLRRARGDLDGALGLVDGLRASLPDAEPWLTDRRLADLFRLDLLADMGRLDVVADELHAMRPWEDLGSSSCRRYPSELGLTARAVVAVGCGAAAAELLDRTRPFAGQTVVLGWGEGLIVGFDECISGLAELADGSPPTAADAGGVR